MSTDRVIEVMTRAHAAQRLWAAVLIKESVRTMAAVRRAIAKGRNNVVVKTVVADTGKADLNALSGDVLVTLENMLFYERAAAGLLKPRKVRKSQQLFLGCSFFEELEPYGVALVYAPANYPFQFASVPAIMALFGGEAVILKMSEYTPSVAGLIQSFLIRLADRK